MTGYKRRDLGGILANSIIVNRRHSIGQVLHDKFFLKDAFKRPSQPVLLILCK